MYIFNKFSNDCQRFDLKQALIVASKYMKCELFGFVEGKFRDKINIFILVHQQQQQHQDDKQQETRFLYGLIKVNAKDTNTYENELAYQHYMHYFVNMKKHQMGKMDVIIGTMTMEYKRNNLTTFIENISVKTN